MLSARVLVDRGSVVAAVDAVTTAVVVASVTCCDVVLSTTDVVESAIGAVVTVNSPAVVSS